MNTLAPLARGSSSGDSFLREVWDKFAKGKKVGLVHKVLDEFEFRPSELVLPAGQVMKRFEGQRLHRVAWKIVRGLYFHNFGAVLPERTPNQLEVVVPGERPPELFSVLPDEPIRGQYPGVFDYKYTTLSAANSLNYWAILLWDKIIMLIAFHDIKCTCDVCVQIAIEATHSKPSTGRND